MLQVYTCLTQEHDPALVLVAAAICLFASLTAFTLAGHLSVLHRKRRRLWLAALAFVAGTGVWATHFIAMLAYQPHLPTAYSPGLTTLSIIVSIGMSLVAFTRTSVPGSVLSFGAGIGVMHFTGMAALETTGRVTYDAGLVGISIVSGGLIAASAMLVARRMPARVPLVPAALFTIAVCTIHFGSMTAAVIYPDPGVAIPPSSLYAESLAIAVTSVVAAMLGVALATVWLERRIAQSEMLETDRLKHFTESAREGLLILDGNDVLDANSILWCMACYDPDRPPQHLAVDDILPGYASMAAKMNAPSFFDAELSCADGTTLDVEAAFRRGSVAGVRREMVVIRDITDRKAAAARIAHLVNHDPLTGASNRLALNHALGDALAEATNTAPAALLCLDLDRFKSVNDLYGHPAGDAVLVEITRRVRSCLEPADTFARLGGDEFAIMRPFVTRQAAEALALRIIDALSKEIRIGDGVVAAGASIGIALYPNDAQTADELHRKADLALYRAKGDGRGAYRFYDESMDRRLIERHRLAADLRKAVGSDQLQLHFQPLVCLATRSVIGFEALLRWTHPDHGEVQPSRFIPLAEESGLILPIGEWALREACAEAAGWSRKLKIAVNLSPMQFAASNVAEVVARALRDTGLEPGRLDLEITEGLLIKDAEAALDSLGALKELGVGISMDDFGTGYSSLGYFRRFPFDKVKIDRSFVGDMTENPQTLAIVKAMIGLGRSLGIRVLAEGVETGEQMLMLQELGCEQIQGFVAGAAGPISRFQDIVHGRGPETVFHDAIVSGRAAA